MTRTKNLVIMFTDIVGYSARTAQQSRVENEALLREHDALLLPIVRRCGGRRVKSIGDALMLVFDSPTDAVRCAMALQDAVWAHNQDKPAAEQLHIRVALNVGEVRLDRGDVFGEAVNIAARIEGIAPADEVYFSEAVYLAMNKAEVPAEAVGTFALKGMPEPVRVYRAPPFKLPRLVTGGDEEIGQSGLPFGGMHRVIGDAHPPVDTVAMLERALGLGGWLSHLLADQASRLRPRIGTRVRQLLAHIAKVPRWAWAGAAAAIAAGVLAGWVIGVVATRPIEEARADILASRWDAVEARATELRRKRDDDPDAHVLLGHVAISREQPTKGVEHYARALACDDSVMDDDLLVRNLIGALARPGKPAQELLIEHANGAVIEALAVRAAQPGYWGRLRAIEALRALGKEDEVDETEAAIQDLRDAPDCSKRREALLRIRAAKVERALPAVRAAADTGIANLIRNACLTSEAQATITELEGG